MAVVIGSARAIDRRSDVHYGDSTVAATTNWIERVVTAAGGSSRRRWCCRSTSDRPRKRSGDSVIVRANRW
ncbi:hypothetical protein B1756_06800 [Natrarchaeobaculum aegyptiacum]|uniref:Uncharacterized protein n=1 Tax=Natrarchaeobaculum aegyptiacum TaxID=745377 RepID=A0A2Z2HR30_9EURY|nr:hypothetical protein B1756_06800 [Natrarchaeobaculum aegyptiacum]